MDNAPIKVNTAIMVITTLKVTTAIMVIPSSRSTWSSGATSTSIRRSPTTFIRSCSLSKPHQGQHGHHGHHHQANISAPRFTNHHQGHQGQHVHHGHARPTYGRPKVNIMDTKVNKHQSTNSTNSTKQQPTAPTISANITTTTSSPLDRRWNWRQEEQGQQAGAASISGAAGTRRARGSLMIGRKSHNKKLARNPKPFFSASWRWRSISRHEVVVPVLCQPSWL